MNAQPRPRGPLPPWACHLAALVVLTATLVAQRPSSPEEKPADETPAVAEAILEAAFSPGVDDVFAHVRFLADREQNGRRAGSPGGRRAADYISAKLEAFGLRPAGDEGTYRQEFPSMHMRVVEEDGKRRVLGEQVTCANVLAWLPGTDSTGDESEGAESDGDDGDQPAEFLLIAAHYDHLGERGDSVFLGADDNASGVAGLLGIAQAMAENKDLRPRHDVLFCAFDAEEQGLRGAEHFVRNPARPLSRLVTMINLDMIGRGKLLDRAELELPKRLMKVPEGPAIGVLGAGRSPSLERIARAVFAADDYPMFAPKDFGMLEATIEKMAEGRADHAPFERRRIPFLFFSNSEHDDYHEPTDTLDTLDPDALHRVARNVYRTMLAIDALEERPRYLSDDEIEDAAEAAAERQRDG